MILCLLNTQPTNFQNSKISLNSPAIYVINSQFIYTRSNIDYRFIFLYFLQRRVARLGGNLEIALKMTWSRFYKKWTFHA